ncbi:peptidoglycan DD-metalloendopeptidase family protein [Nocardia lijiangensis]|uniref:peptidoglycan DD-metalloendopeptidase family protein n=1 Tax=Nocardia lijiangensis TaxID=299618 RepID=UPI000A076D98|nr:peptidoglycan DD-metalloendopeptidase family protein [Nocardia lijiangensis]
MAPFDLIISTPVDPTGFTGGLGGPNANGHTGPDWFIRYGMDIGGSTGTSVFAAFDGHITKFQPHNPVADAGKTYGAHIFVRAPDDKMGGYYTHITGVPAGLSVGSSVSRGDLLGTIFHFDGIPSHLHFALVEIVGGLPGGTYVGVDNLYDLLLSLHEPGGDGVASVTFNQDGTPPVPG